MPAGAVWVPLAPPVPQLHAALLWNRARMSDALRALLDVAATVLPDPAGSAHDLC
jgi:hypothetical protein